MLSEVGENQQNVHQEGGCPITFPCSVCSPSLKVNFSSSVFSKLQCSLLHSTSTTISITVLHISQRKQNYSEENFIIFPSTDILTIYSAFPSIKTSELSQLYCKMDPSTYVLDQISFFLSKDSALVIILFFSLASSVIPMLLVSFLLV